MNKRPVSAAWHCFSVFNKTVFTFFYLWCEIKGKFVTTTIDLMQTMSSTSRCLCQVPLLVVAQSDLLPLLFYLQPRMNNSGFWFANRKDFFTEAETSFTTNSQLDPANQILPNTSPYFSRFSDAHKMNS